MTSASDTTPHRIELQSLRGFAAVAVMVHHAVRTVGDHGWAWAASEVPLNARGAVVLFFVLSGYVLSLSLMRRGMTAPGVATFYARRAFRVYPALWAAIALGAAYLWLVQPLAAPDMAAWAQDHYRPERLGAGKLLGSIAGLDNYLLPTSWTITVELLASLLLPLIVFVMMRWRPLALPMVVALLMLGLVSGPLLRQVPFYIGAFATGAALACLPAAQRLRPVPLISALAALVLMSTPFTLPAGRQDWAAMLVETLASAVLIAGLVTHRAAWMRARPLVAIGDWSYSIYLLHLPIAYTIMRLLDRDGLIAGDFNLWAVLIALATAAVTVPLAALIYRFVELPGIVAGALLLRRVRGPVTAAAPVARVVGDA
jgi:peptidoglycan/LPS O-acetylase OafA/YrhL